jgi:hypothetical protein
MILTSHFDGEFYTRFLVLLKITSIKIEESLTLSGSTTFSSHYREGTGHSRKTHQQEQSLMDA